MRTKSAVLVLLLTLGMGVVSGSIRGQEVPPADPVWPVPLQYDRAGKVRFFGGRPSDLCQEENRVPVPSTVGANFSLTDLFDLCRSTAEPVYEAIARLIQDNR
jgi:hypothetical protein